MKKKLLFVTMALGYGIGGSEKALIEMLKRLDLNKFDISVLSLTERPKLPFEKKGIKITYGCESFLHMTKPLRQAMTTPFQYSFKQLIIKLRIAIDSRIPSVGVSCEKIWEWYKDFIPEETELYDVVIGYGPGIGSFYAIDKVQARKKILWVDTDLQKANFNLDYFRRIYDIADQVVVVDKSGIERFSKIYPEFGLKTRTIRNIIPVDEIKKKATDGIGFEDEYAGIRILSVGRLCEAKAFHLAVGAAKILKQKGYSFKWYIVGWGSLENNLRNQIKECGLEEDFILLGQQMNPYPFFAQTDIYVQTSIYEGSPVTIEEAIAFNKPIVSTDIPAIYEIIEDGKNGLISSMQEDSIAEKLAYYLDNPTFMELVSDRLKKIGFKYDKPISDFNIMIEELKV